MEERKKSLWTKNNKLLKNSSGAVINCRDCPCGYFALFAFLVTPYNQETGEIDECAVPTVMVQAFEVINSKINFSGYFSPRCIEIYRQPDDEGKVGYVKSCTDCWEDCCEWNEDYTECLRTCLQCMDCSEVKVYRMSSCFETEQELAAFLYPPCNIEPDPEGKYPDVFMDWYGGQKIMTEEATNCANSYWQGVAESKYLPRIVLNYTIYDLWIVATMCTQQWIEVIDGYYTWCDGTCYNYDEYGNCTDCDGTLHTEPITHEEYVQDCHIVGMEWNSSIETEYVTIATCDPGQSYPECYCENLYNPSAVAGLADVNEYFSTNTPDKENYINHTDYSNCSTCGPWGSAVGCMDFQYNSEFQPGECWASWAVHNIFRKVTRYAKFTVNRHDSTPQSATAIKCKVWCYYYKGSDNNCPYRSYALVDGTEVIYDGGVYTFTFGQTVELPIADNIAPIALLSGGYCINYYDNGPVLFSPNSQYTDPNFHMCQNPGRVWFRIKPIEYVY